MEFAEAIGMCSSHLADFRRDTVSVEFLIVCQKILSGLVTVTVITIILTQVFPEKPRIIYENVSYISMTPAESDHSN